MEQWRNGRVEVTKEAIVVGECLRNSIGRVKKEVIRIISMDDELKSSVKIFFVFEHWLFFSSFLSSVKIEMNKILKFRNVFEFELKNYDEVNFTTKKK